MIFTCIATLFTHTHSYLYYIPVIVVTVVALLFPAGKSSRSSKEVKQFNAVPSQTTTEKYSTNNHVLVDDSSLCKKKNE